MCQSFNLFLRNFVQISTKSSKKQPLLLLLGNIITFLRRFGLPVKYTLLIRQIKCIRDYWEKNKEPYYAID